MFVNVEQEYNEVLKCVEIDMLLKSVEKLEQRIKQKYYDYYYPQVQYPSYYGKYPYTQDEAKKLLEIIYNLLKKLRMYLESKNMYQYYKRYFEEYQNLLDELCEHYQVDTDEFEGHENFKQLLTKGELKEFEKVERVAELLNKPQLIEQWKERWRWGRMSFEEKLAEVVDRWWQKKKKEEQLSKQPKYGAYTVKEWLQRLNLNKFQQEYAKRHPWLLASESGRSLLKILKPFMIEGENNGN